MDWITYLADLQQPPMVISIAYTADEYLIETSFIDIFNIEAIKVARKTS